MKLSRWSGAKVKWNEYFDEAALRSSPWRFGLYAAIAGAVFVVTWAAFIAFAYAVFMFFGWWIGKSNESVRSWFIFAVLPFILFGLFRFLWFVLVDVVLPRFRQPR